MFWETCAKHSFEILAALIGSGILGYLFSRWFGGDHGSSSTDNSAYENQIRSLRDRIKQQDNELQASAGLKDTWTLEKDGLHRQLNSFDGFVSPDTHDEVIQKANLELKAASQRQDMLTAEREGLLTKIKNLEAKVAQNNNLQANVTLQESRITDLEAKLKQAIIDKTNAESKITENQHQDLNLISSKDTLIQDLNLKLKDAEIKVSENDLQIQKLHSIIEEKNNLIADRDGEWKSIKNQLDTTLGNVNVQTTQKENELKELSGKNQLLLTDINQLQIGITKAKESELAITAKSNELQARIHQLEQERNTLQTETDILKAKAKDIDKVNLTLQEYDKKIKEWEGRWKQASTEAEQYKVAHAQATKSIDDSKLQNSQLEVNTNALNAQLNALKSELEIANQRSSQAIKEKDEIKSYVLQLESNLGESNSLLDTLQKEHDATKLAYGQSSDKLEELHSSSLASNDQIKSLTQQLSEANYFGGEWEGRYNESTNKLSGLSVQLEESQKALSDALQRGESLNEYLKISEKNLQDTQSKLHQVEEKALNSDAERENSIHELNSLIQHNKSELAKAQQTILTAQNLAGEWESKYKDLSNKYQSEQTKTQHAVLSSQNLISEWETKFNDLHHAYQSEQANAQHTVESSQHLVNEWETKFNDLHHAYQSEQANAQHALESAQHLVSEWETKFNDLHHAYQSEQANAQHALEFAKNYANEGAKKYNELSDEYQALKSQWEASEKKISGPLQDLSKSSDTDAKYQVEVIAWQKRIADLESEQTTAQLLHTVRHAKEVEAQQKLITSLQNEIQKLKSKPKIEIKTSQPIIATPLPISPPSPKIILTKKKEKISPAIINMPVENVVLDWKQATVIMGKKIKADNHMIVEGIGPKINALLKKSNIKTWVQLSNTPIKDIQTILDNGGSKFSLAEPTSWPAQAKLASIGAWAELKKLQNNLTAGRVKRKGTRKIKTGSAPLTAKPKVKPVNAIARKRSKPLDLNKASEILGSSIKKDDLKIVEGIGPKIEKLLKKANIDTWKRLARTETKTIQSILDKAGSNYSLANPKTWAKQSSLAAIGEWAKLKKLQDKLVGGN